MLRKLSQLSAMIIIVAGLIGPQRSAACPTNCTLIRMVCTSPNCNGFQTLYLLLECNGQMQLCPVGCCG